MNEMDKMDHISKHDFLERYLKKGKIAAIYRAFNSESTDNTEFIAQTTSGNKEGLNSYCPLFSTSCCFRSFFSYARITFLFFLPRTVIDSPNLISGL